MLFLSKGKFSVSMCVFVSAELTERNCWSLPSENHGNLSGTATHCPQPQDAVKSRCWIPSPTLKKGDSRQFMTSEDPILIANFPCFGAPSSLQHRLSGSWSCGHHTWVVSRFAPPYPCGHLPPVLPLRKSAQLKHFQQIHGGWTHVHWGNVSIAGMLGPLGRKSEADYFFQGLSFYALRLQMWALWTLLTLTETKNPSLVCSLSWVSVVAVTV